MVLGIRTGSGWLYAETLPEMLDAVAELMIELPHELDLDSGIFPGEIAVLRMFGQQADGSIGISDNFLHVSVNRATGYGGLTWYLTDRSKKVGGVYDFVWVTDNPKPPEADPRVVSDPGYPRFYDRRSAVPLDRVRDALEEFCREGTGDRPESVNWTPGEVSGRRLDEDPIDEESADDVDPFA